jgi:CO/xanthine dehydrogenase FAD-binding subunit
VKLREFIRPASLSAARELLRELGPQGMALAGGTALHFMQDDTPCTAVDVSRLGLSFIRPEGDFFVIGATTPLSDIQRHRAPRWAMHEICRRISTHQIRNISTIGGNICRVFPWADLPVVLLAMNARMIVFSGQDQEVSADDFFASQPVSRFRNGDLLSAVKVPVLQAHLGFGSVKAARNAAAFSLVTVAVVLELQDGHIKAARVAAGSAIPFPRRLLEVEASLTGREATTAVFQEAAAKAKTAAPWRGREGMSAEYSQHLAEVSLLDALERAATFARERAA